MKKPLENAKRWLAQAENSLGMTQAVLASGYPAGACFNAEQTAQLALKAFLFFSGRRFVNIHSVKELASQCAQEDPEFSAVVDHGLFLDRYYLATRYPDALPDPAVPFESFTNQEAQQALDYATEIVELVRGKIPQSSTQ